MMNWSRYSNPLQANPTEHWPFKTKERLGPGPLQGRLYETDDWDCRCEDYRCVCRGISPATRGKRKIVTTDPATKKKYNRLYREWLRHRRGARS